MLKLENVYFEYNEKSKIFENINLIFPENKFISIIGDNGSGKSTLAKLISGLVLPDKGKILIDNFDTSDYENLPEIRKIISMIMPNPDWQLIGSTVSEEIASGLYNLSFNSEEINQRVCEVVNLLDIKHLYNRTTDDLSGGEKQIINLASVLVLKPSYLILDEPISMLDKFNQKIVFDILKKLKSTELSIILITHSIDEILLSDYILGLQNGKIKNNFITIQEFIEKNIYTEYNFNLNFEMTLKKELKKIGVDFKNIFFDLFENI